MVRKLPWLHNRSSSNTTRRTNHDVPRAKRPRRTEPSSDIESDFARGSGQGGTRFGEREPSTSPPPGPPEENFMRDGLEADDKFRMVEDEFMEVAKLFTQHLHEAEYKRMKEVARMQNADTISSISRPVTQKMPDPTRRKVEGVLRANDHAKTIDSLLSRRAENTEDDSDDAGSAWIGTALHGLMDSPRKHAANLLRVGSITATTRAAAGYRKSKASGSVRKRSGSPRTTSAKGDVGSKRPTRRQTSSSDEEDDLNGPVSAPKFSATSSSMLQGQVKEVQSRPEVLARHQAQYPSPLILSSHQSVQKTTTISALSDSPPHMDNISSKAGVPFISTDSAARIAQRLEKRRLAWLGNNREPNVPVHDTANKSISCSPTESVSDVVQRLEQRRLAREKREQQQVNKRLDVVPSFL